MWKNSCPSSLWCRDSYPWPLERESPPRTTRPGLPPLFCLLSSFQTNITFLQPIIMANVHPVNGAGIWTHNFKNLSLLPLPLDQGSSPPQYNCLMHPKIQLHFDGWSEQCDQMDVLCVQRDSNKYQWSRRKAHWALDHHHDPYILGPSRYRTALCSATNY